MPGELADEHVVAICQVLSVHHVSFVIIGGIAARLHQTGYATVDVDICPARDESNLGNLAAALRALGARLRVALRAHSVVITIADTAIPVASLEDVIVSKRAAGRAKDIVALPELEAHLRRGEARP